jgi:hypothetical protein
MRIVPRVEQASRTAAGSAESSKDPDPTYAGSKYRTVDRATYNPSVRSFDWGMRRVGFDTLTWYACPIATPLGGSRQIDCNEIPFRLTSND